MIKFIQLGKVLKNGMYFYQQKDFVKAKYSFEQALVIDSHDFMANYWTARTSIMLGDYVNAQNLFNICRILKPKVVELLITPWEILINRLDNGLLLKEQLQQCDLEINNNLHKCFFKKQYSIIQLFTVLFIGQFISLIGIIIAVGVVIHGFVELNELKGIGVAIVTYIVVIIELIYFHFSTLLPLNLWLRFQWVKEQIHKLIICHSFRLLIINFLSGVGFYYMVITLLGIHVEITPREVSQSLWWLAGLASPLNEELIFRLAWYNYLAKYGEILAYIGVSLLFMLSHLEINLTYFLLSIVFIWSYNKYQNIFAPIMLHFLYNLSLPIIGYILAI
ncbi:type II CAAX endopeptidase family protein [Pelosinus sp. IPA-1]|uniref:type II CAAX endopeptidase family protein n=1 Tax=Pelosinus sp. IPA-1 TaxID=3029569 RepID=UPI00243620A7|nr:type II CAAX endopeptidase family protein [Pelosinus sp. IPA-1]GMA99894.1 hypothetical protein PIPA1_26940 [Pelosinus sp. IPA-1]